MPIIVEAPARTYWELVGVLKQFGGWRSLWRVPAGALLAVLPWGVAVGGFVAAAYLTVLEQPILVVLAAVVGVALAAAAEGLRRRQAWRRLVAERLAHFEQWRPERSVALLVREADSGRALRLLRRAQLSPMSSLRSGSVPPDRPDLAVQISVAEPLALPASQSDALFTARVLATVRDGGLNARVAGVDVWHGGW